jgi:hypothetical protein
MSIISRYNIFLPVIFTISILGIYTGESHLFGGLSPYSSAYVNFEENIFNNLEEKKQIGSFENKTEKFTNQVGI